MNFILASALAAFSLFSCTTAIPTSNQERSIERRWDAPPLPPCPAGDYTPFTYLGCYAQPSPETLQYNPNLNFNNMTVDTCTATCKVIHLCSKTVHTLWHTGSPMGLDTLACSTTAIVCAARCCHLCWPATRTAAMHAPGISPNFAEETIISLSTRIQQYVHR